LLCTILSFLLISFVVQSQGAENEEFKPHGKPILMHFLPSRFKIAIQLDFGGPNHV